MNYIKYESGIYKIIDLTNEILYVGQAVNLHNRYKQHLKDLKAGKHDSKELQEYSDKVGLENLSFVVIELCRPEHLLIKEAFYIKKMRPLCNYCLIDADTNIRLYNPSQLAFVNLISGFNKKQLSIDEIESACEKNQVQVTKKMIGMLMPKIGWRKYRLRSEANKTYFMKK